MEGIVTQIVGALSPSVLPVIVLCLGGLYLWFRFGRIEKDREQTKAARDKDSLDIHDAILKLQFEMSNLKGITDLHRETLEDLRKQMTIVVKELAELNCSIKMILEEKRK